MRPTRTVENSWNRPLLKESAQQRVDQTGFKESKRLRPIGQTNRPCSCCQREDKEKRGARVNQREPQMGARGWETRGDSQCRENKGIEREGTKENERLQTISNHLLLLHLPQLQRLNFFCAANNAAFCWVIFSCSWRRLEDDKVSKSDSKMQLLSSGRKDSNWLWQKCIYIGADGLWDLSSLWGDGTKSPA